VLIKLMGKKSLPYLSLYERAPIVFGYTWRLICFSQFKLYQSHGKFLFDSQNWNVTLNRNTFITEVV